MHGDLDARAAGAAARAVRERRHALRVGTFGFLKRLITGNGFWGCGEAAQLPLRPAWLGVEATLEYYADRYPQAQKASWGAQYTTGFEPAARWRISFAGGCCLLLLVAPCPVTLFCFGGKRAESFS